METINYAETARRAAMDHVDKTSKAFKIAFISCVSTTPENIPLAPLKGGISRASRLS